VESEKKGFATRFEQIIPILQDVWIRDQEKYIIIIIINNMFEKHVGCECAQVHTRHVKPSIYIHQSTSFETSNSNNPW